MDVTKTLGALLRARCSLIVVTHRDELRAERGIAEAAALAKYETRYWDCATGITSYTDSGMRREPLGDPAKILKDKIGASQDRAVWVLRDLHRWLVSPLTLRQLLSTAREIRGAPASAARAIIVLVPDGSELPPELQLAGVVLRWPSPDRDEVGKILSASVETTLGRSDLPEEARSKLSELVRDGSEERAAVIDAALGLSAAEVETSYSVSMVLGSLEDGTPNIDPARVRLDKKRLIESDGLLGWYEPDPRGLGAVGGLGHLKEWLLTRKDAMSEDARVWGLPAPKGAAFVSISGCGKSLTAKAAAAAFGVPCLRLDLGSLKSKYVGESEGKIRRALEVAETVAPCVLWLDEVEKALGGATGPQGDGGVASDALGCLLGWMQEHTAPVFVVATANEVANLPPEFLRKGRFDEVWFVDLPVASERKQILTASLVAHNRNEKIKLDRVVAMTDGFSGAELAALVVDALYLAWGNKNKKITAKHLEDASVPVVPLSKMAAEKIGELRAWAKGRARPASKAETIAGPVGGPELDLRGTHETEDTLYSARTPRVLHCTSSGWGELHPRRPQPGALGCK
jgi:hypothetical protein